MLIAVAIICYFLKALLENYDQATKEKSLEIFF